MSNPRPRLLTPVALGLTLGMLAAAIYLGVKGAQLANADCAPGTAVEDCLLETQISTDLSRFFFLGSSGLLSVSVGMLILLRPKKKGAA